MKMRRGYSGVHFFDRRTGVNVLMDEILPSFEEWSPAPKYVSFALTNACELSCPYCYASKQPARLSGDAILKWAKELDEGGSFGLGLGGGEPTLFPGFAGLCKRLHEETDLAITMTTHGHRFDQALVKKLNQAKSNLFVFQWMEWARLMND